MQRLTKLHSILIVAILIVTVFNCQSQRVKPEKIDDLKYEDRFNIPKIEDRIDDPDKSIGTQSIPGAKKLNNPYTLDNMQKAFNNIKSQVKKKSISGKSIGTVSKFTVKASHYYIKFKPATEEQEGILKSDSTMFLSDYPLDWDFTDAYLENRTALPEGKFLEYYVAIPVGKALPKDVPYEIIEELYIPEEDPLFNTLASTSNEGTQKGTINDNEDLLRHLLNQYFGNKLSSNFPKIQ